jgi:D-glycero-alpha-D-manno-heptose 1-phosphate guanylyltransferase
VAEFGALMDAAILAGGLGTRLRSLFEDRPKVLAPVAGRPFLSYLLDQVAATGIRKVVLCTGHLGGQVEATFGERYGALQLSYSCEPAPQGTAGALRLALPCSQSDPLLVLNGDSYCDVALADFASWHHARTGGPGSLLLTWVDDAARYGTVAVDDDDVVQFFREKTGQSAPGWINAGIYILSRRLLLSIPDRPGVSIEREVFPMWVGRGLTAHRVQAPFIDIGTPESYAQAERFFTHPRQTIAARM